MKILEVLSRDIVIKLEFSVVEINMILDFLNNCTIALDSNNADMVKADKYVKGVFKELVELVDNIDIDTSG